MMSRKARKGEFGGNWRKDQDTATQKSKQRSRATPRGNEKVPTKGGAGEHKLTDRKVSVQAR